MKIIDIASLILLILLMGVEYYGVLSERIWIKVLVEVGIFQQCFLNVCDWFNAEKFKNSSS